MSLASNPPSSLPLPMSHGMSPLGAAGYDVAFVHPKSAVGVLVELVQAPDDVIQALTKK